MRTLHAVVAAAALGAFGIVTAGARTLEKCIETALEASPDAQAASYRVDAARAAIEQAESGYYPVLTLSSTYARTDNPPQAFMMALNQRALNMADPAFNPNEPDDTENIRLSAGVKYRLFDAGRRGLGRGMAKSGEEAARAGLAAVRNELIHQVTRGYYGVLQAQAFVQVQEENVHSLKESLRVAGERHAAGSAVKTDVLNLEVKLAQAREDLIRAQNGVQLAIAALNTAIGRDLVGPDGLSEAEKNLDPPPASEDLDAAAARPELKAARAVAGLREKAWKSSRREHVPVVNAFGSLDWDSEELSDFEQSYMAGVMAEWDIFTGFRKSQAAREARAQWQAARAEETRALNNLRLDLKQAHLQAGEAWQRLDVARKTVASAEEAWRITRERYEQGAADITELLTAEVGLTATRSRNVAAYYDYLVARSNLLRARGELVVKYAATESR